MHACYHWIGRKIRILFQQISVSKLFLDITISLVWWVELACIRNKFCNFAIMQHCKCLGTLKQERLKRRNTLGCLDQYAAQNSRYARPPIPSHTPTQKVFFQWHTPYDPTMKHSHCETVDAKELFQWLFFELAHSLRILSILPTYKLAGLTKEWQWCK